MRRKSQLMVVDNVLEVCWARWSVAVEESRRREIDQQSLYKYRQKTHVIEEGEGKVMEAELKGMFPVYEFMEEEGLEEKPCDAGSGSCGVEEDGKPVDRAEVAAIAFSPEELQTISSLHLSLYHREGSVFMGTEGIQSSKLSYELAGFLARSVDAIPGGWAVGHGCG